MTRDPKYYKGADRKEDANGDDPRDWIDGANAKYISRACGIGCNHQEDPIDNRPQDDDIRYAPQGKPTPEGKPTPVYNSGFVWTPNTNPTRPLFPRPPQKLFEPIDNLGYPIGNPIDYPTVRPHPTLTQPQEYWTVARGTGIKPGASGGSGGALIKVNNVGSFGKKKKSKSKPVGFWGI